MSDVMITDSIKQQVITRLATINSAISIFNLTNGKPAKISVDDVLDLAGRIERWAWRDLLGDRTDTPAPEKPASRAEPTEAEPEPAAGKPIDQRERPTPQNDRPRPNPAPPRPNGHAQWGGAASEKQIAAIFAIGRSKGYDTVDLKALVSQRLGKKVSQLTSREASKLIDDLKAL